jgi:hypothetical protein
MYGTQPVGGVQMVGTGVGGLLVGVDVGDTVGATVVGVGDTTGTVAVGVEMGTVEGAPVGTVVGDGKGKSVAVGLGAGISGVDCDTTDVGSRGWMPTGRSCNASTKAATSVSRMEPTAASPIKIARQRGSPGLWSSV